MTSYIAHITIEAKTPLKVGSSTSDFLQDSPVQKDWNNLPMILGTSIAGVLRKDFSDSLVDEIFGKDNGSKVIISNALLLDEKMEVCEKLLLEKSCFLQLFDNLPIREHTAITDKGVAKDNSKFDEEVVYAGSRFKFSIELIESNKEIFETLLSLLATSSFRVGGGSTKGFGKIEVVEIKRDSYDENSYKNYSSSLNHSFGTKYDLEETNSSKYTKYTLNITPDDFFMFGSGFGDSDADMTPVYEQEIDYTNARLSDKKILIPASSIKGALAHRTTYYYNLTNRLFIGNSEARESIKELFGEAKNSKKEIDGSKGKILISDCFQLVTPISVGNTKVFDHVAIDRFTGGAIDGALFQEKTISDDRKYEIEILLEKEIDEVFVTAFKSALSDITTGMLALGGATTKGHGVFSGSWSNDEK